MTENEQRKKLRRHHKAIQTLRAQLERPEVVKSVNIPGMQVRVIAEELRELTTDLPDVKVTTDLNTFFVFKSESESWFNRAGITALLARVLAALEAELEEDAVAPGVSRRALAFMKHAKLREIVERDDFEITRAAVVGCWKSVIVLAGGAIEGMLLDRLLQHEAAVLEAKGAPKKQLLEWDLFELMRVAKELKIVTGAVDKLSDAVRDYRNLVHPGKELREDISFGQPEARVAIEVLNIVVRELSALR